ncbi:hypothetical protein CPBF426_01730 [Xanthomonas arboricola pv. juglandis]|jgi:hypothetical protein|nr:hypothetical protein [Xanthomonas euroxanthea]MBB3813081.1 hypothetical protein [Xanthomonas euroxanthea]NIK40734.1 hypothetical protein [Xanthomonas euroxanthea]SYZ49943.1 hypothetical protein CPBF426_01730 [Xanthomonas arboricola pv. juglandis]
MCHVVMSEPRGARQNALMSFRLLRRERLRWSALALPVLAWIAGFTEANDGENQAYLSWQMSSTCMSV